MTTYRFRFQSILNIKHQKENSLKNELGKAIRALEKEKDELRSLKLQREKHLSEFNETCKKSPAGKLALYNSYISLLNEYIREQKESVNNAAKNVDIARGNLYNAAKERKMFSRLNEKHYVEYIQSALKEENMLNEEASVYKYFNKNSGDS